MQPRVIVLFLSAAVIFSLVQWRLSRERDGPAPNKAATDIRQLAPRFELYDQHSQLVKFERYLGRTRLLVLFIADAKADEHPLVQQLAKAHAAIDKAGVQVIVVGTATPFAIREAEKRHGEPFPFPILTDINQLTPEPSPTHRHWGLASDDLPEIRQGLFLIDRDGTVAWTDNTPQPAHNPKLAIEFITSGDLPK